MLMSAEQLRIQEFFSWQPGPGVSGAIEAAGGYLPEAALTCVNRAGVLTDGQLYILTQEEMEQQGLDPAENVQRHQMDR